MTYRTAEIRFDIGLLAHGSGGTEFHMILFTFANYEPLRTALESTFPGLKSAQFKISRYKNGELFADIQTSVAEQECIILGSIAPPDEQLLSLTLLAHTMKKEGAKRVTALLPYLAYTRQDKDKPGQSLATAWAGLLIRASGCDTVITVDVHSQAAQRLFPMPVVSVFPSEVFANAMKNYQLMEATIVAPDNGAIRRCEQVKAAAGMPKSPTPYFEKRRTETGIIHAGPIGKVDAQAVIIDDILDTGGTLVSACERLVAAGVQEIHIMVTHGLFTGEHWKTLWSLGVKRIFCTDTVPLSPDLTGRIVTLSIVPLLEPLLRQSSCLEC